MADLTTECLHPQDMSKKRARAPRGYNKTMLANILMRSERWPEKSLMGENNEYCNSLAFLALRREIYIRL